MAHTTDRITDTLSKENLIDHSLTLNYVADHVCSEGTFRDNFHNCLVFKFLHITFQLLDMHNIVRDRSSETTVSAFALQAL